jgi:hypothetical protein
MNGKKTTPNFPAGFDSPAGASCQRSRPPKASTTNVKDAAEILRRPLNDREVKPESTQTIGAFVGAVFSAAIDATGSTEHLQRVCGRWESQLKPRCESSQLNQFTTLNAQQMIDNVARQNPEMKRSSLVHLKNLLSLIFDEAEWLEVLPRGKGNPVKMVRLPNGRGSSPAAVTTFPNNF